MASLCSTLMVQQLYRLEYIIMTYLNHMKNSCVFTHLFVLKYPHEEFLKNNKNTSTNRNNINEMFLLLKSAKPKEFTKLKKAIVFLIKENRQIEGRALKQ
jgi:hypothetical protein